MNIIWANGGGINWTWFAGIILNSDGTATIAHEGRLHRFDYSQGAAAETLFSEASKGHNYEIIEKKQRDDSWGAAREAVGVRLDGFVYALPEPVDRWSFTQLPPKPC